jgi:hypothetical protein
MSAPQAAFVVPEMEGIAGYFKIAAKPSRDNPIPALRHPGAGIDSAQILDRGSFATYYPALLHLFED